MAFNGWKQACIYTQNNSKLPGLILANLKGKKEWKGYLLYDIKVSYEHAVSLSKTDMS